jgi:phage protein D
MRLILAHPYDTPAASFAARFAVASAVASAVAAAHGRSPSVRAARTTQIPQIAQSGLP